MRRLFLVVLLVLTVCAPMLAQPGTSTTTSVVPRLIRFSGTLMDGTNHPLAGTVGVTFSIYKQQQGGAPLWSEVQNVKPDTQGKYSILLGAAKSDGMPAELFASGEAQWLGVRVEGQKEQARVLLVSVPYAMKAAEADTLAGHAATEFVTTDKLTTVVKQEIKTLGGGVTATGAIANAIAGSPTNFSGSTTDQIVGVTQSGTGAGIWSTAVSGYGVYAKSGGTAIYALSTATSTTGYGIYGSTASTSGYGMFGVNTATTGVAVGVRGSSTSNAGIAVYGTANTPTGTATGVKGITQSPDGYGVFGQNTSTTGVGVGLRGTSASTSGIALYGTSTANTGVTKGMFASVASAEGTAAVFQNTASGKLFSGIVGMGTGTEVFSVSGAGGVTMAGNLNVGGTASFLSPVTFAPTQTFAGDGSGLANVNAAQLGGFLPSAFATSSALSNYVAKAGDTMTGALNLPANGLVAGTTQLVLSGGFTGIGTATPDYPLSAETSTNAGGLYQTARFGPSNPVILAGGYPTLMFNTYFDPSAGYRNYSDGYAGQMLLDPTGGFYWRVTDTAAAGSLNLGTWAMTLSKTGNLGIGLLTPAYKLDVAGTARFSGLVTFAGGQTFPGATVSANAPLVGNGSSGSPLGMPSANGSTSGFLTATDWNAFNGKLSPTGNGSGLTNVNAALLNGLSSSAFAPQLNNGLVNYIDQGFGYFHTSQSGYYTVRGYSSGTGSTKGIWGTVDSSSGTAGYFENSATTGKAVSARVNSIEVMSADQNGIHAGPAMTGTPYAYGTFDSSGNRLTGSANLTCPWDSTATRYNCSLAAVTYSTSAFTVVVTPNDTASPLMGVVNTLSVISPTGFAVRLFNLSSTSTQAAFSVVVYKP